MGVTTLAAINGRGAHAKRFGLVRPAKKKPTVKQAFGDLSPSDRKTAARAAIRGTTKKSARKPVKTTASAKKKPTASKVIPNRSTNMVMKARRKTTRRTAARKPAKRRTAARKPAARRTTARRTTARRTTRKPAARRTTRKPAARKAAARRSYKRNGRTLTTAQAKRMARKSVAARRVGAGRSSKGVKLAPGKVYYTRPKPKRAKGRTLPKSKTGIYLTNRRRPRRKMRRNPTSSSAAYAKGWDKTFAKKKPATRRKRRKVSVGAGRGRAGRKLVSGSIYYKGKRKPASLRGVKRARRMPKSKVYLTNKRRAAARKGWRTRRGAGTALMVPNRRRSAARRPRRVAKRRTYRRNGLIRNGKLDLKNLFKSGAFVGSGILVHRIGTNALNKHVVEKYLLKPAAAAGLDAASLAPVLSGAAVLGLGAFIAAKALSPQRGIEVGAGMMGSFLLQVVGALMGLADPSSKYAGYLSGVSQSRAAAIGFGAYEQRAPQQSILPMYTPTGPSGGFQQAVAGGVGEYFESNPFGEYFASGIEGVGSYEEAGPLAMQAAAGMGEIDDGIRPDSDLDQLLMLQSAQAGVGRAFGEYYSANQQGDLSQVPQGSTWIPGDTDGALWAGTKGANDKRRTSQEAAGILESASGNGIF
jgi:hypothetical protein